MEREGVVARVSQRGGRCGCGGVREQGRGVDEGDGGAAD